MNQRTKYILQCVFVAAMLTWTLFSEARDEKWGMFWWTAGALVMAALIGTLGPLFRSRTRKLILKNMTAHEKVQFSRIGQETGNRIGIRVAPIAFLIGFLFMLFGDSSLLYTLPLSAIVLFVLCLPIWQTTRRQTNDALLSTTFAQANGITTLK